MDRQVSIDTLARAEIRNLRGYHAAEPRVDTIKMHANEAPFANGKAIRNGLNRYPELRPQALACKMANYYGVATDNVLVTRGSSEGIDLLVRTFCNAGKDNVLLTPPTFEMYAVYAAIQGAATINVALLKNDNFAIDPDALLDACTDNTKLIFICSPGNPVGAVVPEHQVRRILEERQGRSVVVVDEAYVEFSDSRSFAALVQEYDNLVVLRTLSKAFALAGVRCGAAIAASSLIKLLDSVLPPYALPSPVVESAATALDSKQLRETQKSIQSVVDERERLRRQLAVCNGVLRVWPSQANFLLVEFENLAAVQNRLERRNILIRTFSNNARFDNFARITVASRGENDCLLDSIENDA